MCSYRLTPRRVTMPGRDSHMETKRLCGRRGVSDSTYAPGRRRRGEGQAEDPGDPRGGAFVTDRRSSEDKMAALRETGVLLGWHGHAQAFFLSE